MIFHSLLKKALLPVLIICSTWSSLALALEILTIGDSITQGLQRTASGAVYGVTSPVNGAANVGGYQSRLNSKLDAGVEASTLYNWGVGGENSAGGVNRINSVLNSRSADYILVMYGANDLYQGISSSSTKANIGSMIDQSTNKNIPPIIAEITPNTTSFSFDSAIYNDYNPKIRSLAQEKNVSIALVSGNRPEDNDGMRMGWYDVPYHSGDNLHLSDAGYDKISQIWVDVIKSLYQKPNIIPILQILLLD